MDGGAWPFFVREAICQINFDNERDSNLLNRWNVPWHIPDYFLEGQIACSNTKWSKNRSVMPLDVQGRTRATLKTKACIIPCSKELGNHKMSSRWGLGFAIFTHERGISSKH